MNQFSRHIQACNTGSSKNYIPFMFGAHLIGQIRPPFAQHLKQWPDIFHVNSDSVDLLLQDLSFEERNREMEVVLQQLDAQDHISHLHGEQYEATAEKRGEGVVLIDRTAAAYFGIRAFGQHVNGYVNNDGEYKMWLGRRSMDRKVFPGRLDQIAAGGLPCDISLEDNLKKECYEEASIPAELAQYAKHVSTITYNGAGVKGFRPDTIYCYDLELPVDFVPICSDGEVESFDLLSIKEVMKLVAETDEFKINCNLVVIDFLIRHGYIKPDHPEYSQLVNGLHPQLMQI